MSKITFIILAVAGLLDATYLATESLLHRGVQCSLVAGCDVVLGSSYSHIGSVPIALIGAVYYLLLVAGMGWYWQMQSSAALNWLRFITSMGLLVSLCLMSLMLFVIHSICIYCVTSAAITLVLFLLAWFGLISKVETINKEEANV